MHGAAAVVVEAGTTVDECCKLLESERIRRVPVIDQKRRIVGIVPQADIARRVSNGAVGQMVFDVSKPPAAARGAAT